MGSIYILVVFSAEWLRAIDARRHIGGAPVSEWVGCWACITENKMRDGLVQQLEKFGMEFDRLLDTVLCWVLACRPEHFTVH